MTYYMISGNTFNDGFLKRLGMDEKDLYVTELISESLLFITKEATVYFINDNIEAIRKLFKDVFITEIRIADVRHERIKI